MRPYEYLTDEFIKLVNDLVVNEHGIHFKNEAWRQHFLENLLSMFNEEVELAIQEEQSAFYGLLKRHTSCQQ